MLGYHSYIPFHYANVIMLLYVYVCREHAWCMYVCTAIHIYAGRQA